MSKMLEHHDEDEGGEKNSERWLLTYSDMITLLLALFIIMYSMSQVEAKKFTAIAEQLGTVFHGVDPEDEGMAGYAGTGSSSGVGVGIVQINPLDEIFDELSAYVQKNHLEESISLENTETYVRVRIQGMLMFYPDSPRMLESSKVIIGDIAKALLGVYDKVDHITITGHTADIGERSKQSNDFSWSLSVNRADAVRQSLVANGLKEAKLSLEGYAHYSPVSHNKNEEGRAKNRRAEITIYKYSSGSKESSQTAASSK